MILAKMSWPKMVQGYITGQILPVDGGEWFGKKPMMQELLLRWSWLLPMRRL